MDISTFIERFHPEDVSYCADALVNLSGNPETGETLTLTKEVGESFADTDLTVTVLARENRSGQSWTLLVKDNIGYYYLLYGACHEGTACSGRLIWFRKDDLKVFKFEEEYLRIKFHGSTNEYFGVRCDDYEFRKDPNKDLGVLKIDPGCKTPRQQVVDGDRTIEGFLTGKGKLIVSKPTGEESVYEVSDDTTPIGFCVEVNIGDIIQWVADQNSHLMASEVCYPPYQDGRFKDLD